MEELRELKTAVLRKCNETENKPTNQKCFQTLTEKLNKHMEAIKFLN